MAEYLRPETKSNGGNAGKAAKVLKFKGSNV